jgi:hypothetical protein
MNLPNQPIYQKENATRLNPNLMHKLMLHDESKPNAQANAA